MKYTPSSILSILLMLSFYYSNAQSNDLDFTITSNQMYISGETVSILSTITKSGNTMTWKQEHNGNSDTSSFKVINMPEGSWDQLNTIGAITYEMDSDDYYRSQLFLKGTPNKLYATLTLYLSDTEQEAYTFYISNISYQ